MSGWVGAATCDGGSFRNGALLLGQTAADQAIDRQLLLGPQRCSAVTLNPLSGVRHIAIGLFSHDGGQGRYK